MALFSLHCRDFVLDSLSLIDILKLNENLLIAGRYEGQSCRGGTVSTMIKHLPKKLSKKILKSRPSKTALK